MAAGYDLPIIHQGENLLISAHLLHKKLKVQTRFGDWIKRRIQEYGFQIDQDFYSNLSKSQTKPFTDYLLTLDTAKEMAMVERNETGRSIRRYFIQKEKELRAISHLPKEASLFKGLKPKHINGIAMYPYMEMRTRSGYSPKGSSANHKYKYWMHFVKEGAILYCTADFALQLFHQKQVANNRQALKAMQPVLPFNFGQPLKVGGAHA